MKCRRILCKVLFPLTVTKKNLAPAGVIFRADLTPRGFLSERDFPRADYLLSRPDSNYRVVRNSEGEM